MSRPDSILTTIAEHRAAYDAFQVAPDGEPSIDANCAMSEALDALVLAACSFPLLARPLPDEAAALLAHLRWWLAEEAVHAGDYQLEYGILEARAADLDILLGPPLVNGGDPILEMIASAEAANTAHTAALDGLDEADDAQMRRANAAAHATSIAFETVQRSMPATLSGLLALTDFYGRDAELYERSSSGSAYLRHVASGLRGFVARKEGAEPNLVELARMYGGVCGDLWVHRHLLQGVLDEAGELS